jgi:hypothetical protein
MASLSRLVARGDDDAKIPRMPLPLQPPVPSMLRSELDLAPALASARGTGVGFAVGTPPVAAQAISTDTADEVTINAGERRRMRRARAPLRTTPPTLAGT